jgi:two-component system, OmpR family, sensor kinase
MKRLWRRLPLVVKRVVVAGLLVAVAVATLQVVLWRFAQDQKRNLVLLTDAYLNGLSAAVLPALVRGNQRLFDALDHARRNRYAGVEPRFVIVELPNKAIAASSDPRSFPVQSVVPDDLRSRFAKDGLNIDPTTDSAWLARTLNTEWGTTAGRLLAEVDIAASLRVRREILLTLVLINGCLALAFVGGGYFVLKRLLGL